MLIAQELALDRRRTGSDVLMREGAAGLLKTYEARLQEAEPQAASPRGTESALAP
jgi:hypothetical protein